MRKSVWILSVLLSAGILLLSCQKAKEAEKKEIQMQGGQQPISAPIVTGEIQASPLTEDEQKDFEKIGGGIPSPNLFKSKKDALRYLKILLKGNEKTIRWYVNTKEDAFGQPVDWEKEMPRVYAEDICTAIKALALKHEEAFELIIKVMKTKSNYPPAYACACETIGWYAINKGRDRVKEAIPLLKEAVNQNGTKVRLEAAGALISSGETDVALPVLNELAKQGEVRALLHLYEPENREKGEIRFTRLWDSRGLDIFKKAMEYPSDEVKGYAANALAMLGEEKVRAEVVALNIVKKLANKTKKDYGFQTVDGSTGPKNILLSTYEGSNISELEDKYFSDSRACNFAMYALGKLQSKSAISFLEHIKSHMTPGFVCENWTQGQAENAIKDILKAEGVK